MYPFPSEANECEANVNMLAGCTLQSTSELINLNSEEMPKSIKSTTGRPGHFYLSVRVLQRSLHLQALKTHQLAFLASRDNIIVGISGSHLPLQTLTKYGTRKYKLGYKILVLKRT